MTLQVDHTGNGWTIFKGRGFNSYGVNHEWIAIDSRYVMDTEDNV